MHWEIAWLPPFLLCSSRNLGFSITGEGKTLQTSLPYMQRISQARFQESKPRPLTPSLLRLLSPLLPKQHRSNAMESDMTPRKLFLAQASRWLLTFRPPLPTVWGRQLCCGSVPRWIVGSWKERKHGLSHSLGKSRTAIWVVLASPSFTEKTHVI